MWHPGGPLWPAAQGRSLPAWSSSGPRERPRSEHAWRYLSAANSTDPGLMAATVEPASQARAAADLQAAIDKALTAEPVTSPTGVTSSWGRDGTVLGFSRSNGPCWPVRAEPSVDRGGRIPGCSPGPFVFGPRRTTEARLGDGLTAWYATTPSGFEQGFTVSQPPTDRPGELQHRHVLQQLPHPAVVALALTPPGPAGRRSFIPRQADVTVPARVLDRGDLSAWPRGFLEPGRARHGKAGVVASIPTGDWQIETQMLGF